jgi:hypothetical protein
MADLRGMGSRFQRFLYKGLGTPKAGTIPPTTLIQ